MKFILFILPLVSIPTLVKREDPGLLGSWLDKQNEKKDTIAKNEDDKKKDASSSPALDLGSLAGNLLGLKKDWKKQAIGALFPVEFGLKQLEAAKEDLKVALKDDKRTELIPMKELHEIAGGLSSFWNGLKGTWDRLQEDPERVAKAADVANFANLVNGKHAQEPVQDKPAAPAED